MQVSCRRCPCAVCGSAYGFRVSDGGRCQERAAWIMSRHGSLCNLRHPAGIRWIWNLLRLPLARQVLSSQNIRGSLQPGLFVELMAS